MCSIVISSNGGTIQTITGKLSAHDSARQLSRDNDNKLSTQTEPLGGFFEQPNSHRSNSTQKRQQENEDGTAQKYDFKKKNLKSSCSFLKQTALQN